MKKYSNKAVIDSLGLPMMTSFEDLSQNLRLSAKLIHWLTSDSKERYQTFNIPKSDGTSREISAPVHSLKIVQRWILVNILYKIKTSPYSYGFSKDGKGSPLVRCAERHKGNLYILKMDVKGFYPSIKREKIYHQFTNIGYNANIANLLTNLCVYEDKLPQGAVCSPYLANLVCRNLDFRIAGYCNRRDIIYTRYADDLTFSCDNRDALKGIYGTIRKILKDEGFQLNERKSLFLSPKCRKRILGITVNDGIIKAPKELKRTVRSMIHTSIATKDFSGNDKIRGYVAYINSIEPNYTDKVKEYIKSLTENYFSLFADIVDEYNKNKIYSDLPDMKLNDISNITDCDEDGQDILLSTIYTEYEHFLSSRGIVLEPLPIVSSFQTDDEPF